MKRPLIMWSLLTVTVFLLWLYNAANNIDIIVKTLTTVSGQVILVLSLLVVGLTIYSGIRGTLDRRKAGQRLFYLGL